MQTQNKPQALHGEASMIACMAAIQHYFVWLGNCARRGSMSCLRRLSCIKVWKIDLKLNILLSKILTQIHNKCIECFIVN